MSKNNKLEECLRSYFINENKYEILSYLKREDIEHNPSVSSLKKGIVSASIFSIKKDTNNIEYLYFDENNIDVRYKQYANYIIVEKTNKRKKFFVTIILETEKTYQLYINGKYVWIDKKTFIEKYYRIETLTPS